MPHVALVPFTGFRVCEAEMLELGMRLPSLRTRLSAIGRLPALGLLTLAGLTPNEWTCSYHEAPKADEAFLDELAVSKPDLVAVSALTASVGEAYRFAAGLKKRGLPSVLGGLHATSCPEEALQHFDAVVVGEGELVWPTILADTRAGRLAGLYRPEKVFDLRQAPVPRFDLLTGQQARFTLQTQRGCPLACEFCGASRLLGNFREKPLERIAAELEALTALQPSPTLELADDNTFAGSRDPVPFLDLLGAANARWFTAADWRLGERPEVLNRLAASGCVQVLVGIESLIFRHRGMGAKTTDLPRVMAAIEAIQAAGVAVVGCFIVGSDGETRASLDRLGEFIQASSLAEVQLTLETPFPGTALHRRLKQAGRLIPERDWSHYTLFDVTYQPDLLTLEELESGFKDLVRRCFAEGPAARRAAIRRQVWERNPRLRSWELKR